MLNYNQRTSHRAAESGNVLFLILIAVALFAALSYAVTSTTRTTDNRGDQTDGITAAALVQYPAGVRTAIMRMIINGVAVEDLEFNQPAGFDDLTSNDVAVFHPDGGNATYQSPTTEAISNPAAAEWYFNAAFEIDNIGSEQPNEFSGNDIIAFLPGVREGICRHINRRMGLDGPIPNSNADLSAAYTTAMDHDYVVPATETILGAEGGNGTDSLTGQPFGCFRNAGGDYVYYHVLIER
ncbi:MAG: hypothetical protein KKA05_03580 [Alphaproteobacteria bacterium]|nr:hypothetical protein [Alphaproteobacteria bacterium]MBU0859536.1 hypothetical protein [Alphaproteobacteria bacterium]